MTAPADAAFEAFRDAMAHKLIAAGVIGDMAALSDRPLGPIESAASPIGGAIAVAVLVGTVRTRRTFIGSGRPIYLLDVVALVEFATGSHVASARQTASGAVLTCIAELTRDNPRLGGAVERMDLDGEPVLSDAPPVTLITTIPVALAISAGDPLGRTAAS